jgi:hypothetical protein
MTLFIEWTDSGQSVSSSEHEDEDTQCNISETGFSFPKVKQKLQFPENQVLRELCKQASHFAHGASWCTQAHMCPQTSLSRRKHERKDNITLKAVLD